MLTHTQTQVVAGQSTFVIENESKPVRSFKKKVSSTAKREIKWVVVWCFGKKSYGIAMAVIDSAAPTGATDMEEYYI